MTVISEHGGLAEGSDLDGGITREGVGLEGSNPTEEYKRYSNEVLGVRSFNALAHHPRLVAVMQQLVGAPLLIQPRHICHAIFPGQEVFKAPPHQDFKAVRGTPNTWTAWLPFGELDGELGGVTVAEGSHTRGLLRTQAGMLWVEPDPDARWLWSPMQTGDVLMFHSLTVHQGRENISGNRLRLAGSYPYQLASDPVHEGALLPQHRYGDWDELSAGWPQDDPLRYYWKSLQLNVQPADHPTREA